MLVGMEVVLPVADVDAEDAIEGTFWELGVGGFERWDDETWTELIETPRARPVGGVLWRAFFEESASVDAVEGAVREALAFAPSLELRFWEQTDMSFLTAWREFFRPTQVSKRILVHPPWDVPATTQVVKVEIDPGMAFGTGTHETTRLCLRAIDDALDLPDANVLDVGTGSGILAIAAALLGAARVVATENDPVAVGIANENFERNGVSDRCAASLTLLEDLGESFDLVVANILPHTLSELHDGLLGAVRPGGTLVLSGILVRERDNVIDRFSDLGVDPIVTQDGEWCAIAYRTKA
jgi:ribosomal protein L11 methyltransferase